jgi:hypothetical protein
MDPSPQISNAHNHHGFAFGGVGRWLSNMITLRSLLDHMVLGGVCCVTGIAVATFSGLVISGIIALPMIAPLALPILIGSCGCFTGGVAMVSCHFFWPAPRRKTLPHERPTAESAQSRLAALPAQDGDASNPAKSARLPPSVIPAQVLVPAQTPKSTLDDVIPAQVPKSIPTWTHEQIVVAFKSNFQNVDVTIIPWLNVGTANNGGRCFANTALQSLFHNLDFRNLIYIIIKLAPNAREVYPIIWAIFEIMQHMQCNPTSSLPQQTIEALLRLVDATVGNGAPFFITGTHDAEKFASALCDALSNDFSPESKFDSLTDRIDNSYMLLTKSESEALARLHISWERLGPTPKTQSYLGSQDYREAIFHIFGSLRVTETINGEFSGASIATSPGIVLNFDNSRSCQDSLDRYLRPYDPDSGGVYSGLNVPDGKPIAFSIPIPFACLTFCANRNGPNNVPLSDMRGVRIDSVIHLPRERAIRPVTEKYELRQIFCNTGGHWLIYARCDDGKWREFDDAVVREISEETMRSKIERWKTNGRVDGDIFMRVVYLPIPQEGHTHD